MTEAELILADIILLKIEPNTPFRMQRYLHNVTIGLSDTQPEHIYKEICDITISRSSVIEDFLRIQGYVKFTDAPTHQYILTEKGEDAQKQGGHQQYLEWAEKEKGKSKKGEFPKLNTIIYDGIKIAIGLAAGIIIGKYSCNQPTKASTDQSNSQLLKIDTPYLHQQKNSDTAVGLYGQDSNHHQGKLVSENNDSTK